MVVNVLTRAILKFTVCNASFLVTSSAMLVVILEVLQSDQQQSTPPVSLEVSERLTTRNVTRPFFAGAYTTSDSAL